MRPRDLGFDAVDAGPLKTERLLEPLAMLWIDLAMKRGQGRNSAFAPMHRSCFGSGARQSRRGARDRQAFSLNLGRGAVR